MQGQESEGHTRAVLDLPIRRHSVSQGPIPLSATCNSTQDAGPSHHEEVFSLTPEAALRILCMRVDKLAEITGDVPSTTIPVGGRRALENPADEKSVLSAGTVSERNAHAETEKGDRLISPTTLMKCFYSKKPSLISLETYLLRLHRYCPMSTAVYLATSYYITRIAVREKIIYVTPRNMHRLVLGGLRVAMKMLEDLCYRHSRFARVGGVTERELTKLEINFSFLMDFELRVDEEMLFSEVESFQKGA
ncbi:hypothetical protein FQN52_006759 [Onygenales sp. PD_12]|nr:hypothetical protein FQN52_006759 [Onygenales sp. PD_12]KAK2803882.1 hypothetical protein FQN51_002767 [Onygenales sp. PD_10]